MRRYNLILINSLILISAIACKQRQASDHEIKLNSLWKFKTGDAAVYAQPGFDDSEWTQIPYNKPFDPKYNGFAWYRYKVVIPSSLKKNKSIKKLEFVFGRIDDRDNFYLNDSLIGSNNKPDTHRKYEVPIDDHHILWDKENTIAIRVFDNDGPGGMTSVFAYINPSKSDYPNLNIVDNKWKFTPHDSAAYASPEYNDSNWSGIRIGEHWENQGFPDHNGVAWYRTSIKIPGHLKKASYKTIKLCLGTIDDNDQVFLNGSLIGENNRCITPDSPPDADFAQHGSLWNVDRIYSLDLEDKRIKWDDWNTIAVRVNDHTGPGGLTGALHLQIGTPYDAIHIDDSRLYQFNAISVDTTVTIQNSGSEIFKGFVRYKGTTPDNNILIEKENEITIPPKETATVGVSLPYTTEQIILTFSVDDIHSANIYKDEIRLPFVLWR